MPQSVDTPPFSRYEAAKEAFFKHVRIIAALVIRETSARFGSKFGGYAWALAEPTIHIILLSGIFSVYGTYPPLGTSFMVFYASGYLAMQFYTTLVSHISAALNANKALMMYPLMAPIDFVVARYILQFVTLCLVAIIVLSSTILYSQADVRVSLHVLLPPIFLASAIALGIGLFNVVAFQKSSAYEQAFSIAMRPMFILSGVFFLPEHIPPPFREWLLWNPITHVIMWFRQGIYPYYRAIDLDKGYVITFAAVSILLGMTVFSLSKALRDRN